MLAIDLDLMWLFPLKVSKQLEWSAPRCGVLRPTQMMPGRDSIPRDWPKMRRCQIKLRNKMKLRSRQSLDELPHRIETRIQPGHTLNFIRARKVKYEVGDGKWAGSGSHGEATVTRP